MDAITICQWAGALTGIFGAYAMGCPASRMLFWSCFSFTVSNVCLIMFFYGNAQWPLFGMQLVFLWLSLRGLYNHRKKPLVANSHHDLPHPADYPHPDFDRHHQEEHSPARVSLGESLGEPSFYVSGFGAGKMSSHWNGVAKWEVWYNALQPRERKRLEDTMVNNNYGKKSL